MKRSLVLVYLFLVALAAAGCGEADEGTREKPGRGIYVRATWQDARGVTGHRVHVVDETIACSECHDLSGAEVDVPGPRVCARCHEKEAKIEHALERSRAAFGADAPSNCMHCHAFVLPQGQEQEAEPWACMRCHESAQGDVPAVVIHKQSTCDSCHRPHQERPILPSDCLDCHEDISTTHASAGKQPSEVCTTCHQDQHAVASLARNSCASCHAETKPVIPASALFEGGHAECTGCHRPHDYEKEEAVPCRSCHENVPVLGGGRVAAHAACDSCHRPHAVLTGMAGACVRCHGAQSTDHPSVAGKSACDTCHDAHPPAGRVETARACSHCHHGAGSDRAFHGQTRCSDCHRPHRFQLASTDRRLCSRCHAPAVSATAGTQGHQRCEGCHAGLPHRPGAVAACTSCHGQVAARAIPAHRACASCHEPHGGDVVKACSSCHAAEARQAPAGHRACASCHDAHLGTVEKSCSSCHGDKANAPHANVRGGCISCHSAHGPRGATHAPSCQSCHAVTTLPTLHQVDRHQSCNQCHAAHRTKLGNERSVCLSCHQDRQNHFPDAPRCSSCHLFR